MSYFIIAIIIVFLDQLSKLAVIKYIDGNEIITIPIWNDIFHLTSHRNAGAAFGILQDQRYFFIIIAALVVSVIVYAIYKYESHDDKKVFLYGITLMLGGAIGNLIDRIFIGKVIDFLDFRLINFPIFNIADMAVCFGVALLFLDTWLTYKIEKEKRETI